MEAGKKWQAQDPMVIFVVNHVESALYHFAYVVLCTKTQRYVLELGNNTRAFTSHASQGVVEVHPVLLQLWEHSNDTYVYYVHHGASVHVTPVGSTGGSNSSLSSCKRSKHVLWHFVHVAQRTANSS